MRKSPALKGVVGAVVLMCSLFSLHAQEVAKAPTSLAGKSINFLEGNAYLEMQFPGQESKLLKIRAAHVREVRTFADDPAARAVYDLTLYPEAAPGILASVDITLAADTVSKWVSYCDQEKTRDHKVVIKYTDDVSYQIFEVAVYSSNHKRLASQ